MIHVPWLGDVRAVILDVDGVLYRGNRVFREALSFVRFLVRRHIPFVYLTNNSTLSASGYAARLQGLGFPARPEQVIGSAEATAHLLDQTFPDHPPLLVVGEQGLRDTLRTYGFPLTESADEAGAVVVGMDRDITYARLAEATYALRRGVPFFATNPDRTFPTERGLAPGAGALLAALVAASERRPTVVGKPEAPIFQLALTRLDVPAQAALMVGDRLDTDIAGARKLGLRTALVLTGVTTTPPPPGPDAPDLVLPDLARLQKLWEAIRCRR